MSPGKFKEWWSACEDRVAFQLRGWVIRYPTIEVFADRVAGITLEQVRSRSRHVLSADFDYFKNQLEFLRWMSLSARREMYRVLCRTEPVEAAMSSVGHDNARLLRFAYLDQLCLPEIARTLDIRTSGSVAYDEDSVLHLLRDAYGALCERIGSRSGGNPSTWTAVFPPPPVLACERRRIAW